MQKSHNICALLFTQQNQYNEHNMIFLILNISLSVSLQHLNLKPIHMSFKLACAWVKRELPGSTSGQCSSVSMKQIKWSEVSTATAARLGESVMTDLITPYWFFWWDPHTNENMEGVKANRSFSLCYDAIQSNYKPIPFRCKGFLMRKIWAKTNLFFLNCFLIALDQKYPRYWCLFKHKWWQ